MTLTNLDLVSVPVSDQDRAKQFYVGKLGFTEVMDNQFGEGMRWVMLRPPGSHTNVTLTTWFDTMPPGSLKGSVLTCDDLEKTLSELEGRGVTFVDDQIQEAPWGRWKVCEDPDGNSWIIQQSTPGFTP